jgi:cell division protein YceG involved in septum cleavage
MKIVSRQTIAAMVAGAFMIAAATTPFIVQAAETDAAPMKQHQMEQKNWHQKMSPTEIAQHLADTFGIDQATVLQYYVQGTSFRDIGHAAFLAKASNKSFTDILALKTSDNNWKDVVTTLGITKEQMKATRQDMIATGLNKKIGLDKETALNLLHDGYQPHDIGMAAELSKNTDKTLTDVLALKKINNTWSDVATSLGVDNETFKKDMKEIGFGFGHRGHGCHHGEPNDNR